MGKEPLLAPSATVWGLRPQVMARGRAPPSGYWGTRLSGTGPCPQRVLRARSLRASLPGCGWHAPPLQQGQLLRIGDDAQEHSPSWMRDKRSSEIAHTCALPGSSCGANAGSAAALSPSLESDMPGKRLSLEQRASVSGPWRLWSRVAQGVGLPRVRRHAPSAVPADEMRRRLGPGILPTVRTVEFGFIARRA